MDLNTMNSAYFQNSKINSDIPGLLASLAI
jgi:hypothetical protein